MDSMTSLMRRLRDLEDRMNKTSVIDRNRAVVARYETAAGQSIPNNTATIVDYDTATFDPDSHVTTGAAWKFTAKIAGYYAVHAAILFSSTTTWANGEGGDMRLYKNGVVVSVLDRDDSMDSAAVAQLKHLDGSDLIYLAVGDYIDIRLVQSSGGALTLLNSAPNNYVSIFKVN